MGGVQVKDFADGSPNKGRLKIGDVILELNSSRIETQDQLTAAIQSAKNKKRIPASVVRNGSRIPLSLEAVDLSDEVLSQNSEIKSRLCSIGELSARPICNGYRPPEAELDPGDY